MASSDISRAESGAAAPRARPRTPQQIEDDLEAARTRLSASVEELIDHVHPNRVKQRMIANFRALVDEKVAEAKAQVIDEHGNLRTGRVAVLGASVAGVIGFFAVIRAIRNRGRS